MEKENKEYVLCVCSDEYPASLETWKVYRKIPDGQAVRYQQVRIIDESGEDYLFPAHYFVGIELPTEAKRVLLAAA